MLPYRDIRFLKHFEDVFERFYNKVERFRTVFGYIGSKLIKEHTDTSITGEDTETNHVPPMKSVILPKVEKKKDAFSYFVT